jgi:hypothetical protein
MDTGILFYFLHFLRAWVPVPVGVRAAQTVDYRYKLERIILFHCVFLFYLQDGIQSE